MPGFDIAGAGRWERLKRKRLKRRGRGPRRAGAPRRSSPLVRGRSSRFSPLLPRRPAESNRGERSALRWRDVLATRSTARGAIANHGRPAPPHRGSTPEGQTRRPGPFALLHAAQIQDGAAPTSMSGPIVETMSTGVSWSSASQRRASHMCARRLVVAAALVCSAHGSCCARRVGCRCDTRLPEWCHRELRSELHRRVGKYW